MVRFARRFVAVSALLAVTHLARAQESSPGPIVGSPAPPLTLNELLQAPEGAQATWEKLKGKVVVLEFWATWCVPCVAAFPHINELADKFRNDVQFIAITYEDRKLIKPFLKKKPLHTWVGLDTDRSMHKAYRIGPVPRTLVVDRDGRLVHDTHPMKLTEQMLADLISGDAPAVTAANAPRAPEPPPLFQVMIRPASGVFGGPLTCDAGKLDASGVTLREAVACAYGVPERRIVTPTALPESPYDVAITMPKGHENQLHAHLRSALETTFGIRARTETRQADGYALTVVQGEELLASPATRPRQLDFSTDKRGFGELRAAHVTVETFAAKLAEILQREVFCDVDAEGSYDFSVRWDTARPESLIEALRQDAALDLRPAKRPVEMLIVEIGRRHPAE